MAEREQSSEATWQSPEREGRGGQENAPGDKGQDRVGPDGRPRERSGVSQEAREGPGYAPIVNHTAQSGPAESHEEAPSQGLGGRMYSPSGDSHADNPQWSEPPAEEN
jgi:hypothetical protein